MRIHWVAPENIEAILTARIQMDIQLLMSCYLVDSKWRRMRTPKPMEFPE